MLKENKNINFIQQFVSSASPWRHFGEYHDVCACFDLNVNNVCCSVSAAPCGYVVYVQWILSKMVPGCIKDELLNKVVIFVFFAQNIVVASKNYGSTPDVTLTILTMSLLRFWTLNMEREFSFLGELSL